MTIDKAIISKNFLYYMCLSKAYGQIFVICGQIHAYRIKWIYKYEYNC